MGKTTNNKEMKRLAILLMALCLSVPAVWAQAEISGKKKDTQPKTETQTEKPKTTKPKTQNTNKQPKTTLSLSSYSLVFSSTASSKEITVTASGDWHIGVQPDSWVTVTPMKSKNKISVSVNTNTLTEKRTDNFTVVCGELTQRVDITQQASPKTNTATKNDNSPVCGTVNINSVPSGAEVWLDNKKYLGTTPGVFSNILVGEHSVMLRKKDYNNAYITVYVEEGKVIKKDVQLEKDITTNQQQTDNKNSANTKRTDKDYYDDEYGKHLFLSLTASYSIAPQLAFGFSFGQLSNRLGWYASIANSLGLSSKGDYVADENGYVGEKWPSYTEETKSSFLSATGGVTLRTFDALFLHLGGGLGIRKFCQNSKDFGWVELPQNTFSGIALEGGVMYVTGSQFIFSVSACTIGFKYTDFRLGLGYCF